MKSKSILRLSAVVIVLSSAHAAPLLTDNFDDTNTDASTFNNNLATTQGGSLGPISYSVFAPGGGYTVQHGNGGSMLVVGNGGIPGGRASLNHDFSIEANLADKPLSVSFNIADVTNSGDPTIWGHFGLGSSQNADFFGTDFAIFMRSNGVWNARDNNAAADIGSGSYVDNDLITFVFSNTAGTGSAFNGNGSQVTITAGAASPVTFPLNQLAAGDGFLTWGGYTYGQEFMVMSIDNLSVDMDTTFPAGESMVWAGAVDANWDETTANWSNVNTFTKWFNNPGTRNNAVFDATGSAQPNVSLALTRPLEAGTITFDTAGYNIGGTVTLGNSPNLVANSDATISATLQGSANITKSGLSTLSLTGTSSYSGVTILEDGVINAASFSDYGVDSSLGNRAADGAEVGLLFQGGTLQYTGATAQSTNRSIRLGLEGGKIDASGSVPAATLSFTAAASTNLFFDPGNRTLTFTGTNTGDNTFAMAIGDAGGTTSVVKDGAGKWILSGANAYTGSTTVNGGTLSLTSAFLDNTSAVFLESGAKLNLDHTDNDVIGILEIDGSGPLPGGIYNSTHPTYGSYFTGTGSLLVLDGADGSWISTVDGIWDDPDNWSGGIIATGFDQTATFNAAADVTVTLSAAKTIGNLAFDTSDYTLAGPSTLTLDSSATPEVSVGTGRTATITANVDGFFGMEKTGTGTLVLTASNTFSGETLVTGGLLQLGASPVFNPEFGVLENSYLLTIQSGATVQAMGANAFKGYGGGSMDVTLNGGTLTINDSVTEGGNHGLGFVTLNGGTISGVGSAFWGGFNLNDSVDVIENSTISSTNTNTNGSPRTITVSAGKTLDWSGTISNRGYLNAVTSLIFGGTGTTVLSGVNTYTGDTTINDGTLVLADDAQLTFAVTDAPAANMVNGTGTATFNGDFNIDTSGVAGITGYIWLLVDRASLTGESFGSTFNVIGFTQQGDGVTWTMTDSRGTWTFSEDTGELTLDLGTDYDNWVTDNGVVGTETEDDDNDGLTNFEEYAFGLDPTGGSSVNPISVQPNKSTRQFSYTRRDAGKTDLNYSVWFSTDLATWTQDTGATESASGPVDDVETVEVTLSALPGDPLPDKLFVQVRAQ